MAGIASGSAVNAASLLGDNQRLGDERLGATAAASAPIPDAPDPNAEIIVTSHDTGTREVRVVVKSQCVVQIARL